MKATHTLYVDLRGSDAEHADHLESTVSMLLRGMGLARRSGSQAAEGVWPGCADLCTVDERGEVKRLSVRYETPAWAQSDARTLAEFLLANAWGEHLMAVFVVTTQGSLQNTIPVHGEPRAFLELAVEVSGLS